MRLAARHSAGSPIEIPGMPMRPPAPELTPADRRAIRRRGALALREAGFRRREVAIVMRITEDGVKQILRRTRRLRDEVRRDAESDD